MVGVPMTLYLFIHLHTHIDNNEEKGAINLKESVGEISRAVAGRGSREWANSCHSILI